jgi:GTPase SAR1 family protein
VPQTLESLIGIDNITTDGFIQSGGETVMLMEITPTNFRLKSVEEQESIVSLYHELFKVIKSPFQIITLALKADTSAHAAYMRKCASKKQDADFTRQIEEYNEFVKMIATKDAVSRRFLLAVSYPKTQGNTAEAARSWLLERRHLITEALARCGNDVVQHGHPEYFTANVLYQLLNRATSEHQELPGSVNRMHGIRRQEKKQPSKVTRDKSRIQLGADSDMEELVSPYLDLCYPIALDATHMDRIVCGDSHVSCYLITNYPYVVSAAWLSDVVSAGEGIELSLFFFPQNKAAVIKELTHYLGYTKYKLGKGETQADSADHESAYSHSIYIRKQLAEGDELWHLHIMLRVYAKDTEELHQRCVHLETTLAGKDLFFTKLNLRHAEAFVSSLPLCKLAETFKENSARNVLASDLASIYPFVAYELSDPEGVFFGINLFNQSPVILDIFNSRKYNNANMVVLGSSGSGKTYSTQVLAHRLFLQNIPLFMICPLKGFEYKRMCENLGGQFIRIAPGSKHTINIMDIRLSTNDNAGESLLAAKLQKLQIFFSLMFPGTGQKTMQILDDVFLAVYAKYGITKENETVFEPVQGVSFKPKLRPMPLLGDVYDELQKRPDTKELAILLKPYVSGSLNYFNGRTNVDLDSGYVVADISDVSGDSIALAMFMALDMFWDRIKEDPAQKKAIILDEVWRLIGAGGNALTATYVLEIFKTIRGFGGAGIAATQDIKDFLALDGGKYGRGIINSSSLKLILKVEDYESEDITGILRLSEEEQRRITKANRGQGLLLAASNHVALHVAASQDEHRLITTDRKDLESMRAEAIGV